MATYVIGDVHGCYHTLKTLMRKCGISDRRDRIWMVGDLVNRGPRSLEVLQWAADQGPCLTSVLGNHDLHLLARASGIAVEKKGDTLEQVLDYPGVGGLLDWLLERPLIHHENSWLLVHAGLMPGWNLDQALSLAREAQGRLRSGELGAFMGGGAWRGKVAWSEDLPANERGGLVIRALTRIRYCCSATLELGNFQGHPSEAPDGLTPWFDLKRWETEILFGHWSTLGYYRKPGFVCLDSSCVYGGRLTAMRLEDGTVFSQENIDR